MDRRHSLSCIGVLALASCAGSRAPLKANDVQRIGMLPIKDWPSEGSTRTAPFNTKSLDAIIRDTRVAPVLVPGGLIGAVIATLIVGRNRVPNEKLRELAYALQPINFAPADVLLQSVLAQIKDRSLPISQVNDLTLANAVRNYQFANLPQNMHALLDTQLLDAGYYFEEKAGGFTPYFEISATLWDTVNLGHVFGEFSYFCDYRDSRRGSRTLKPPAELSVPDLNSFRPNAEKLHAGLATVIERLVAKLLDDVQRILDKQPPLK